MLKRSIFCLLLLLAAAGPARALDAFQPPEVHGRLLALAREACRQVHKNGNPCRVRDAASLFPNYYSLAVSRAYFLLHRFALEQSSRPLAGSSLAVAPPSRGMAGRFAAFLQKHSEDPGAGLLESLLPAAASLGPAAPADDLVRQMALAVLGQAGPGKDGLSPIARKLAEAYLGKLSPGADAAAKGFRAIPVSSPRAAWENLYLTLKNNRLLDERDFVAVVRPISPSGLEPRWLKRFRQVTLHLTRHPQKGWSLAAEQIAKLGDSKIKALFLVSPSPVGDQALGRETLEQIAQVVRFKQPRLLIFTAGQLAGFHRPGASLADLVPHNLISMYGFGPRFGLGGWRAGLLVMANHSLADRLISEHSEKSRWELVKRYAPKDMPSKLVSFADRFLLEAQWRGASRLSSAQEAMVALYSLFGLGRGAPVFDREVKKLLAQRARALYQGLGWEGEPLLDQSGPYVQLNLAKLARDRYGDEFADYFLSLAREKMLTRLARKYQTVLLPGAGWGAAYESVLFSLAPLTRDEYRALGERLSRELAFYHANWRAECWGRLLKPLVRLDQYLFQAINRGSVNWFFDLIMPPISEYLPLVPLLLIAVWLAWKQGVKGRYIFCGLAVVFVFSDFCLSQYLRPGLGRIAPFTSLVGVRRLLSDGWHLTTALDIETANLAFSLPSAHAANSMGPAVFLACFHPRLGRWLVPMAFLVGFSRIYLGVHFPCDVLAGFVWGGAWGWALAWGTKRVMEVTIPLSALPPGLAKCGRPR